MLNLAFLVTSGNEEAIGQCPRSRPINQLLNPNLHDFSSTYASQFSGMTSVVVETKELIRVRDHAGIKYKILNLDRMDRKKRKQYVDKLEAVFK